MDNENTLIEIIKKSDVTAADLFDFRKLQEAGEHFLPMQWELGEDIRFQYNIKRMTPFTEVRKEDFIVVLNLLMRVAAFEPDTKKYSFSLEPGNLFYNSNGSVCIKRRDIISRQKRDVRFVEAYKALIACALTGQYSCSDYMEGGEGLLKKNSLTAPLISMEDVGAFLDYLEELKRNYIEKNNSQKMLVGKKKYLALQCLVLLLVIFAVLLGTYSGLQYFKAVPYMTAVITADNAYIENDDLTIIRSLRGIEVSELDKHQKYILARAYLQMESLSTEQKNNILSKLTLSANEKQLEYWIYLGRLEVKEAEDIAMQLSDDELLLYAYLKEKAVIETDSSLTGQEKEQSLQEIQTKIDSLAEQYTLEEE